MKPLAILLVLAPVMLLAQPREVGRLYNYIWGVSDFAIVGDYAYLASGTYGVTVYDISDPEAPEFAGFYPSWKYGIILEIGNGHLVLMSSTIGTYHGWPDNYTEPGSYSCSVIDFSNPEELRSMGSFRGAGEAIHYSTTSNRLLVASYVDMDPVGSEIHSYFYTFRDGEDIQRSADMGEMFCSPSLLDDSRLYLVQDGIKIYDVSDCDRPRELFQRFIENLRFDNPVKEGTLIAGSTRLLGNFGVNLIRLAADTINQTGFISAEAAITSLQIQDQILSFSNDSGNVILSYDVSDITQPRQLASVSLQYQNKELLLRGSLCYALDKESQMAIWDIGDPDQPERLCQFGEYGSVSQVEGEPSRLCIAAGTAGVRVIDASDLDSPRELGSWTGEAGVSKIAVRGDLLLAALTDSSIAVIDITQPDSPAQIAEIPSISRNIGLIDILGDYGLVGYTSRSHYSLVDVALYQLQDRSNPQLLGFLDEVRSCKNFAIFENRVFLPVSDYLSVYSIQEDGSFGLSDTLQIPCEHGVYISNGYLHALSAIFGPNGDWGYVYQSFNMTDFPRLRPLSLSYYDKESKWIGCQGPIMTSYINGAVRFHNGAHAGGEAWENGALPVADAINDILIHGSAGYAAQGYSFVTYELGDLLTTPVVSDTPHSFSLSPAFPNPFNSTATIGYSLPTAGPATLAVYDLSGRLLKSLVSGEQAAGRHSVVWGAKGIPSGVYLVKMEACNFGSIQKVALVR